MENLLLLLATSFVFRISASKKLVSQLIGNTRCSILFRSGSVFKKTKTASGDDLFCNEFKEGEVIYGAILVDLRQQFGIEHATDMLCSYMHKLKGPFYVFHNTGNETSADWNQPDSVALVDYWQDAGGVDCKVKGYTNGRMLAVLYVKNIGAAEVTMQESFLDSFHFGA